MEKSLQAAIDKRTKLDYLRSLRPQNDKADFCSNDYLGFAKSMQLRSHIDTLLAEAPQLFGATGSRLISGNTTYVENLEQKIADFHGAEAGLIFNSGYDANVGLLSSTMRAGDTIIFDELVHASMWDGMRLSRAEMLSFKHNDLEDLRRQLAVAKNKKAIAVESIYSMDGDAAPLEAIAQIAQEFDAALIVDEAHATGVIGQRGEGLVSSLGLDNQVFARVYTFGKAMGGHGAVVLGSPLLRQFLINYARSFVFTTALPMHSLVAIKAAYDLLDKTPAIQQLQNNVSYFINQLNDRIRSRMVSSQSAVQCVIIKGNTKVKKIADDLQKMDLDVRAILYPTVPKGQERLRICLHSFNTKTELDQLINYLNQV